MVLYMNSGAETAAAPYRTVSDQDLDSLLLGLGMGASGGGGGYIIGQSLVKAIKDMIPVSDRKLWDVSAAADDDFAVMAGGIGAPSAITPSSIFQFAGYAEKAIEQYEKDKGKTITGLLPVEAGPVNALLAMYLGWVKAQGDPNFKVFNVDGDGRAVPSLTNLVFGYNDYPIAPVYLAGVKNGQLVSAEVTPPPADAAAAEGAIRDNLPQYGNAAALLCWGQTGAELKNSKAIIKDRFTRLITMGYGIAANQNNETELMGYLSSQSDIKVVYSGTLTAINETKGAGYDYGELVFLSDFPKLVLSIKYENENMLMEVKDTGVALATAPSGISMLFNVNGTYIPYNNGDDLKKRGLVGHRMLVAVMKQNCLLYSGAIEDSFKKVLDTKAFGNYTGPITPTDCVP